MTVPVTESLNLTEKDSISIELVSQALLEAGASHARIHGWLASIGIAPALLDDAAARIPASAYAALWQTLALHADDEFFGMDPRALRCGSLDFLCRTAFSQPSVAAGIESGLEFLGLMLQGFSASLVRQQSVAQIVIDDEHLPAQRAFAYFTYWLIVHGVACWLCGRRIPILGIELRGPAPAFIDDYRVMFSENLRFERPHSRMMFAADCLDLPIRRSPEELQRFLAALPANLLVKYRDPQSLASRIRNDLRQLPAEHWPESAELAARLCMSASTLRRRLAEQGQSYQVLKDSVRKELAIGWLAEDALSFTEIAERLGFADTSSFHKAFRKWSGSNPGHYRQMVLGQTGHPD